MGHSRQVHQPNAIAIGSGGTNGVLAVAFQPACPQHQGSRVVRAQVLAVGEFQIGAREFDKYAGKVWDSTTGEHMPVDKLPSGRSSSPPIRVGGYTPMVEESTSRTQQPAHCAEIGRQISEANMFIHAHGNDLVEWFCVEEVTIILHANIEFARKPFGGDISRA